MNTILLLSLCCQPTQIACVHFDKAKVELMNRKLTEFPIRRHIKFVDCTADARFSLNGFTLEMPDHMNACGAMKFSRILDEGIIKMQ